MTALLFYCLAVGVAIEKLKFYHLSPILLLAVDLEDDVSVTQVQVVDFMLNNPQFDDILSAIEQDLETAAMGKNGVWMP